MASYDVPNNSDYKIGGVRNDNRPWDLNPNSGVVEAELGRGIFNLINIWAGDFVVTAAKTTTPASQARARFKLSLPAKNQRIRGTVRDNTGAVVPRNAIVVFERLDSSKISIEYGFRWGIRRPLGSGGLSGGGPCRHGQCL